MAKTVKKAAGRRRRDRRVVERGQAHIQSTFNNTIVTITDAAGNALSSEVLRSLLHMLHRWLLKRLQVLLRIMV